jgi:hypothetical protein
MQPIVRGATIQEIKEDRLRDDWNARATDGKSSAPFGKPALNARGCRKAEG